MNDVNHGVRKAYFAALNGVVVWNAAVVPIYDKMAPNTASYPYIILSSQTDTEDSVKSCQGHDASMLVDVVTGYMGEVDSVPMDNICGQIQGIINPIGPRLTVGNGFQLIRTRKISDNTIESQNGNYKILRRLLRFDHIIHEQVQI